MSDLISRQAAIAHAVPLNLFGREVMMVSVSELENLPSAQQEREKGKWIPQDHNKTNGRASTLVYYYPKCSVCGHCDNYTNFCSNCGADMRVGTDS